MFVFTDIKTVVLHIDSVCSEEGGLKPALSTDLTGGMLNRLHLWDHSSLLHRHASL